MKFLRIKKRSLKKILTFGLSVLLIVGAVMGCVSLFGRDTSKISSMEFSRGTIDANGIFADSTTSICTKDAILCQGLRIVPDFDASGKFDVHYYDVNDKWLHSDSGLTATYVGNYPAAVYARIVYTPEKPSDVKLADWKIGFLDVAKYAKQLTITVNKEQVEYKSSINLYEAHDKTGAFTAADISQESSDAAYQASKFVELDGTYDLYMVYVKLSDGVAVDTNVAFKCGEDTKAVRLNENGKNEDGYAYTFTASEMISDCWYSVVVEVPHDATALRIQGPVGAEYQIYGVEVK